MQENQPVVNQPNINPVIQLPSKLNNFLIILLSILLLISCVIAGFFAYQTQKLVKELTAYRLQPTATQTPIPTYEPGTEPESVPLEILTKNWEIYTNTENGYLLKFPQYQYIRLVCTGEELTATVRLEIDKRSSPITVGECNRGGKYDIETKTYSSIQIDPEVTKYYDINKKDILINGIKGKLFIHTFTNIEDGPYPKWFTIARVNKNNKTYEIYFGNEDKLDLFYQILSTFKFTN